MSVVHRIYTSMYMCVCSAVYVVPVSLGKYTYLASFLQCERHRKVNIPDAAVVPLIFNKGRGERVVLQAVVHALLSTAHIMHRLRHRHAPLEAHSLHAEVRP